MYSTLSRMSVRSFHMPKKAKSPTERAAFCWQLSRADTRTSTIVPSRDSRPKIKARSVGDFAFFGMWKDRTDIRDSVEYINDLRRNLRG